MDIVFAFAVAWALSRALEHAKQARGASRGQRVQAAEKKSGAPLSPVKRKSVAAQHDIGWWASEVLHGAPVHRTGFHAGWLANKAAAVQSRHRREEARTTHAEVRASFGQALREHKDRRAMALAEIDSNLTDPAGGKEAVRQATAKVVPLPVRQAEPAPAPKPAPVMGPFAPPATDVKPDPQPAEGKDPVPLITVPVTVATSEMTYDESVRKADEIIAKCDVELVRLRAQQVGVMVEQLAAAAVDGTSLGHLADVDEATRRQIQAVQDQHDSAQAFKANLTAIHGQGAEYHHAAPGGGAEKSFLAE